MWVTCSSTGDVNVGFIIGYVDLCQGHTAEEKVSLIFLKSQGFTEMSVSCSTGDVYTGFIIGYVGFVSGPKPRKK